MQLASRQLPQAIITNESNPVFKRDARRVRWFRGIQSVQRYGLLRMAVVYIVVLGCAILARQSMDYPFYRPDRFWLLRALPTFSAGLSIVIDVFYVFMAVTSINSQMVSGEWDLLKLTTLDEQSILDAKYSVAQLRAWRMLSFDRLAQLLLLVPMLLFQRTNDPSQILLFVVPAAILGLLTPLWRMRALTAAGLSVSARVQNTAFALLAGLAVALVLHIGLLAIADVASMNSLRMLVGPLSYPGSYGRNGGYQGGFYGFRFYAMWFTLLSVAVTGLCTYVLCRAMQTVALRQALRSAFRPE